jgi:hypothetical protein
MIAPRATARSIPLVRSLSAGAITMIRAGATIGLPALVLLVGLMWRWWKG